ncbi:glycyl-radical enzyme activating protein [Endozoicomonas sp. SESOKO1]|uniref:glycyl-radical enzyme activating protein n=1 Tax=Endozoicomonas sp. SESOKO1 TaxID=2828742 RepID=UPI002148DEE1|nr:glycyl-radical enzyme activating protein [Endozoicomonas sp. SESOKO1]
MCSDAIKGCIFNIQKFSIHDGPGIRTIVFLKGCPLSCQWCSNPESQDYSVNILFDAEKCNRCGKCLDACPHQAISLSTSGLINRDKCIQCGLCVDACPTTALTKSGNLVSVKEVLDEVCKDAVHYRRSDGGLTLSGGEPLAQPEFAEALLKEARTRGVHTAMETTGMASIDVLKKIIPLLDLVLLDIKSFYSEPHKKFTGVESHTILKNALVISQLAKEVAVRIPVIPGFNADPQSIKAIASFITHMSNVSKVHLLPYHNYGQNKYQLLNRKYALVDIKTPNQTLMQELKQIVESFGLVCQIGG